MAGVKQEIWTGRLIENLNAKDNESWLEGVEDFSRYVENDVIHLIDVGGDPAVLVNNTTYPIPVSAQTDADLPVSLDKLDTENTKVTDDELDAISYNKIDLVQRKHITAINNARTKKAAHAIAPASNTANTPVIQTTGSTLASGQKAITLKDIIAAKSAMDKLEVPDEGRVLVLCPDHMNQLLELDQKFANQYYNAQDGKVAPMMYGFKVYSYVANPYYTNAFAKKSLNSTPISTDRQASIFFYTGHVFKCWGSAKMYYSKAETNPELRQSVIGFKRRGLVLPIKQLAIGAIVAG